MQLILIWLMSTLLMTVGTLLADEGTLPDEPFVSSLVKTQVQLPTTVQSVKEIQWVATKTEVGKQIWSATKTRTSVQNAYKHWKDHKHEFPELLNAKQYVENTWSFFKSPPQGTLLKTRPNGELLRYHQETNTFGSYTKEAIPKTMFRPKDGSKYWETQ